jgi:hypothetical protein
LLSESSGDQVDRFCSSPDEKDFLRRRRVQKPADGLPCPFKNIGSPCGQRMGSPVNVGIFVSVRIRTGDGFCKLGQLIAARMLKNRFFRTWKCLLEFSSYCSVNSMV